MKKIISHSFFFLVALILLATLHACGSADQISGISATVKYSTQACVPQEKLIRVRNQNTKEAQRVLGIQLEPGSNEDKFFKLVSIKVGNQEETAVANLVSDIIIPPGGVMDIKVIYNPKTMTLGDQFHITYLDVVLGNPLLGMQQFALVGQALTAKPGCGSTQGEIFTFTVDEIVFHLVGPEVDGGEAIINIPGNDVARPLQFSVVDDVATLSPEGFPEFIISGPDVPVPNGLPVILQEETTGTFDGATLDFDLVQMAASGIPVEGSLTTGSESIHGDPETFELSLTGSPLQDDKMTLIYVAAIQDTPVPELKGAVVGAEFKLTIKK